MRQQLSVGAPELTVLLETIAGAVIRHSPWTAPSCGPSSLGSGVRWSKSPSAAACIGTTSAGPLNASAQIAPASTATTSFRARESANGVEVPHSGARSTPRVLRVPTHRRSQSAPRTAIVLAYLPVGASPVDREAQEFSGGTGASCRPWAATKPSCARASRGKRLRTDGWFSSSSATPCGARLPTAQGTAWSLAHAGRRAPTRKVFPLELPSPFVCPKAARHVLPGRRSEPAGVTGARMVLQRIQSARSAAAHFTQRSDV